MGAEELLNTSTDHNVVRSVRELTKERGVDVAIEAVGKPSTWQLAVSKLRRGGTVNFFGGCPNESHVSLDTSLLHYSEITCKASFHHTPRLVKRALEIVSDGAVNAADFVIDEAPLGDLLKVFRHMMSHNGHLKTAILPGSST